MNNTYFITGIGTGIGKTVVSAVLTEKLKADYWKPIQSGNLDVSDSLFIKQLTNPETIIHPESYRLSQPLSPHLSARLDGVQITLDAIKKPQTNNHLVIEGAGGLRVPLNDRGEFILDLIIRLRPKVILVSQNYLGSINHTLLTIDALWANMIEVEGIIFNGTANQETEDYIANYTGIDILGKIPNLSVINKETIAQAGQLITL